jgi:hypothetical protein
MPRATETDVSRTRAGNKFKNALQRNAHHALKKKQGNKKRTTSSEASNLLGFIQRGDASVIEALATVEPCVRERANGSVWCCSNCEMALPVDIISVHACPKSKWVRVDMAGLRSSTDRCKLCGMNPGKGATHPCRAVSKMVVDFTGVASIPITRNAAHAKKLPSGHWVTVCDALATPSSYALHHLYVGDVGGGMGQGAVTLSGLDCSDTAAAHSGGGPCKSVVGMYVSGREPVVAAEEDGLITIAVGNRRLNPHGVGLRLNCAHGTASNVACVCVPGHDGVYMVATGTVQPGQQLLWDYHATTDESDDEANAACTCGGAAREFVCALSRHTYAQRGCPGRLMDVV